VKNVTNVSGNPALIAKIADRIVRNGPIDFAAYMEMALYDEEHGYYESGGPIGWDGDFYTSEDLHSVYGELIGQQLLEAAGLISSDGPVTIVEMGPGRGTLCRDILAFLEREIPDIRPQIRYVLIERSARMIEHQRDVLEPFLSAGWPVSWCRGLDTFLPEGIEGVIFSNELVDAFPVHRIVTRSGTLKECFVSYERGRFGEIEGEPSVLVSDYVRRFIHGRGITLEEGVRTEANLNAIDWMQSVAGVLNKGIAVTVDYGYPAYELYGSQRPDGTLLCYVRHQASDDPYVGVGHQDMTAHVDFTALATVGQDRGLEVTGFTNQQSFLLGLGIAAKTTESNEESIARLIHPEGLGRTHKVLIQHTGMPAPTLSGLKYRPFFDSSLFVEGGAHVGG
jgi:SAM-dependent MidA family methyltransferase